MLLNEGKLIDGVDYLKFGGITLLNKKSLNFPKNIENILWRKDNTDLSDLVPYTYMKDILDNTIKGIESKYEPVTIYNKKFIRPKDELKVLLYPTVIKVVVPADEIEELEDDNLIDGKLKLSKSKYLVWY
jgi:hypothetical protein